MSAQQKCLRANYLSRARPQTSALSLHLFSLEAATFELFEHRARNRAAGAGLGVLDVPLHTLFEGRPGRKPMLVVPFPVHRAPN